MIALAARYWFALLGIVIVFRTYRWLIRDRRAKHRRLRQLPDAGMIGELIVLRGNEELNDGSLLAVPWEGCIGYSRGCDITVPFDGVANIHADVSFHKGVGLTVTPRRHHPVTIDGVEIHNRREAAAHPMLHGSILDIGQCSVRLRVFMGLEMEHAARRMEDKAQVPDYRSTAAPQTAAEQFPAAPFPAGQMPAMQTPAVQTPAVQPLPLKRPAGSMPLQPAAQAEPPAPIYMPQTDTEEVPPVYTPPQVSVPEKEPVPPSSRDISVYQRPKPQNAPVRSHSGSQAEDIPGYSAQWDTRTYGQPAASPSTTAEETPRRRRRSEGRFYD